MNEYETLFAKAKEKLIAAKALLEQEEYDAGQVQQLRDEAKALEDKAQALKEVGAGLQRISEPQLPAALPTEPDANELPKANEKDAAVKALYQLQFPDESQAIKAVLRDLHGAGYEQRRFDQKRGFIKYLRTGEGEHREFLWTPATIKLALDEGQDVVEMKAVMVEAQDTLGGYVVPEDWRADVVSRMAGLTVIRPRARVLPTSRDSVSLPTLTGGGAQYRDAVRVTWVDETPTAGTAATNLTFGQEKIPVHTVMAETFLSRNLVEDAAFPIVDWLAGSFASAQAIDEDNQFLTGDGNGRPQGILPSSGVTGWLGTGQQVVSGSASTLTWDGLIALTFKLDAQYRQNAVFIGEKATYEVIAKLKDGDGQYLWRQVYGDNVNVGGAGTTLRLLGYPVLEQEAMPTVGSDTFPLIFGDLRGYVIVDRVGMSVERYIDSATARINQVCYVARRRLGGQGMETWRFAAQKCST